MPHQAILYSTDGAIANISFNRSERRNTIVSPIHLLEAKEYLKTEYNIDKLPLLDFQIIKKEKLIEKFLSFFSGNINASRFLNLQGLISIWIPNI